ncbi:hypothetical protein FOA52_008680 [Chlamydomonas sp. UWO 241]|nr:hypothetical protein FOA52_008680 [Chlamydomonas sp. UWO 241]
MHNAEDTAATIAFAGAITLLVQLLGPGSPPTVQLYAARALTHLAAHGQAAPSGALAIARRIAQVSNAYGN